MVAAPALEPSITERAVDELFLRAQAALTDALLALGEFDAQGGWETSGAASAVAWLAGRGYCTRAEAATHVRNARLIRNHDEVRKAVEHRAISPSHLTQLSAIKRHRSKKFGDDVAMLVECAAQVDPENYRRVASHWSSLADDLLTPNERDERNVLDLAETFAGTWILRGVFDSVRGAALHSLLLAQSGPAGPEDRRTAGERRADAFFEALTGDQPVDARLDVIVDVDTFIGTERPLADVRCELQGVGALDRLMMERLACNPHVGRILVRGKSEVLDLGRQVRLASPALRRAVIARDQGCVWPQCHRPPAMCEIHHLVAWQDGGPTTLENLALVCGRHHTRVHQGWKLTTTHDGTWDAVPP